MSSLAGRLPFLHWHSAESCLRELQLIQPGAFLALPVKHWLKSEVSIADQSLLSVASAFWR